MNTPNPIHASAVDPEGKKLVGSPEAGSPAGVPAPGSLALPLSYGSRSAHSPVLIEDANGFAVAAMVAGVPGNIQQYRAARIVQAVNSLDAYRAYIESKASAGDSEAQSLLRKYEVA